MGLYGIRTQLVLVFITAPGILVPIPAPGVFSWLRGLWQAGWVTGLNAYAEGENAFYAEFVFYLCLFLWTAVQLKPFMYD